jgi:3-isopropylmalate/(R)-2-methylmalate dehydratase small subunit
MQFVMQGRCWKFGDNILNDGGIMTIEQVHKKEFNPGILSKYCMVAIDPEFPQKVKPGDFIIAGRNFGRGQLHIQGPLSVKGLGLGIVTESMVRSFFRLGIYAGLPMLPFTQGISSLVDQGDRMEIDFASGVIKNLTKGINLQTKPLPKFLLDIIAVGGEFAWLAENYGKGKKG